MMKKIILAIAVASLVITGCANTSKNTAEDTNISEKLAVETNIDNGSAEKKEDHITVKPLADTTMENINDAILSVSLEKGDAYVDDTGKMMMKVKIFTYDKYDMTDIAQLKEGDTLVTHAGEVIITSLKRNELGTVFINGGLEEGGLDLVTNDTGIFYETGYNDMKNWYEVGEKTIRVSADFRGTDNADPEKGEITIYPGDFLVGAVTNYNFTPYNTTIRVEAGRIVELTRIYTP